MSEISGLIDEGLQAPLWHLKLPGILEERYEKHEFVARFDSTLRSGWLALLIFNFFLLVDWVLVPDILWTAILIRVVVFTPLCLVVLLTAHYFIKPDLLIWRETPQISDRFSTFSGWAAAICLAVILVQSHSPYAPFYHAGFLVVIIYGNLVQKLVFRYAVIFTVGTLCISGLFMTFTHNFNPSLQATEVLLLVGGGLITLMSNYITNKTRRRNYLLKLQEQSLVNDLHIANEQLQKISRTDVLTGLYNRRHFHDYLKDTWQRAKISNEPVTILMMDVDHFKSYNDHYGHQAGDECLRQISMALEENLRRPGDMVARYGGEEFVAVLPNTGQQDALLVASRVRRGIEHLMMRHEHSSTAKVVTISVGVSVGSEDAMSMTDVSNHQLDGAARILACADQALYEAKHAGRNCVKWVAPSDLNMSSTQSTQQDKTT